ncbi:MAG: hypothetical protein IPK74_00280 [Deltaproteobacteria bacterium]|nr:hypothetical protein [Deltaproteobacteria bacterium]
MLATILSSFALAAPDAAPPPPAPRITSVREASTVPPRPHRSGAPGAWQRLTLIGTLPSGTNLRLLGSARPGTSWATRARPPLLIVDEIMLAIAVEIREGWPMPFVAGGVQQWNVAGGPKAAAIVMTGLTGQLPSLTSLLHVLRKRR